MNLKTINLNIKCLKNLRRTYTSKKPKAYSEYVFGCILCEFFYKLPDCNNCIWAHTPIKETLPTLAKKPVCIKWLRSLPIKGSLFSKAKLNTKGNQKFIKIRLALIEEQLKLLYDMRKDL